MAASHIEGKQRLAQPKIRILCLYRELWLSKLLQRDQLVCTVFISSLFIKNKVSQGAIKINHEMVWFDIGSLHNVFLIACVYK